MVMLILITCTCTTSNCLKIALLEGFIFSFGEKKRNLLPWLLHYYNPQNITQTIIIWNHFKILDIGAERERERESGRGRKKEGEREKGGER